LERWLAARAAEIFRGQRSLEAFPFKIIRDADLRYRPDEEETLEEQIAEALEGRPTGPHSSASKWTLRPIPRERCSSPRRWDSAPLPSTGLLCPWI